MGEVTDRNKINSDLQCCCAQKIERSIGKERSHMTEQEARELISQLTQEEKRMLNEMLKSLEQRRQPSAAPLATTGVNGL